MALVTKSSYSTGELDPVLQERTTLEKFKKGLNVGRNVIITRTGSIITRPPRAFFKETKLSDRKVVLYSPKNSDIVLEWGHLYVRVYDYAGNLQVDLAHTFTETDLEGVTFDDSAEFIYIFFRTGTQTILKLNISTTTPVFEASTQDHTTRLASVGVVATGGPTGYAIDYLVTGVVEGQEYFGIASLAAGNLPLAAGQKNTISGTFVGGVSLTDFDEIRVYRRPAAAGAFGFIGSSTVKSGSPVVAVFDDFGGEADFAHSPPADVFPFFVTSNGSTGALYQGRLLYVERENRELITASRPAFQSNFLADFPLNAASALSLSISSSGSPQVISLLDADGLVAFTTSGVFVSTGILGPNNLAFERRGGWVIDANVPPLLIPGGVLFVDASTNSVRHLIFSNDLQTYVASDQSIFSGHLFLENKITYWGYQKGRIPLLWVAFLDGTFASFTFDPEQEMRAWTRHDSQLFVESMAGTNSDDTTFFVTKDGTKRYIEVTLPRYLAPADIAANTEHYMASTSTLMDSLTSFKTLLNDSLTGSDLFVITPVTPGVFDGPLTLTCGTSGIFTTGAGNPGNVGEIHRVFDGDRASYDLEVTARASDNSITVQPDVEYLSTLLTSFNLYQTAVTFTGLTHLEGVDVTIVSDGFIKTSPLNDAENFPTATVSGGSVTLPLGERGAIVIIGRPVVADAETLQIDTIEQKSSVIESKNLNKFYVKINRSNGLYAGNSLPDNDSVIGMEDLDSLDVDYDLENPVLGNRFAQPRSKRLEVTIPGDWTKEGQVSIRQVDPKHFEILSIISDLEFLVRGK